MIGNVWEWTSDWYSSKYGPTKPCGILQNPRGGPMDANYCRRYRPAARHAEPIDTSTNHVGFRCVVREKTPG
jgi:formylglycine-generating enzyme